MPSMSFYLHKSFAISMLKSEKEEIDCQIKIYSKLFCESFKEGKSS